MNVNVQTISNLQTISIGAEKAVLVPVKVWKKILSALEDLDDIIAYDRAKKNDDGTYYSLEEVRQRLAMKSMTPSTP